MKILEILDYIYQEFSSIPKDFLTEIHLRFFKQNKNPDKKILGVWDFNQRLSRLGDFIGFLEILNVLIEEFNLNNQINKKIDICFIDDENHYNRKQLRFSKSYIFKKNLKLLTITNPRIDSILIFSSNAEFNYFYQKNRKRYIRWPPTIASTNAIDYRIVTKFHAKNEYIPQLIIPPEILIKIYEFYNSKIFPSMPIILNLRKNIRSINRNSNLLEIKKFLKHYENNKKYKFIIICNKSEIPDDFRKLKNIYFSKDYFDSIEYDLGLIKSSFLSIFPSSGMACFAWFSNVPFIQFGEHSSKKYTGLKKGQTYNFFSKYQRHYHHKETKEWLISVFEKLIEELEKNEVNNTFENDTKLDLKQDYLF